MRPLELAEHGSLRGVKFVLTDMDETLTYKGRLSAATYSALEALQAAGVIVIPVTGAPAGWCDQMARMWPVDGVIGENGGLFFRRRIGSHDVDRVFWHDEDNRWPASVRLEHIGRDVLREIPGARLADDQPFRLTSLAFDKPEEPAERDAIVEILRRAGTDVTVNNLWILAWLGGYDKLAMTRRVLSEQFATDIDKEASSVLYCGDSTNDAPMFSFFSNTVGVSTVVDYLDEIPTPPRWITREPGGAGFIEAAHAVIAARSTS